MLVLNKPLGISPLDCIKNFKKLHPGYEKVKMGYAGRLDPMAEGVLLVLLNDENKKRKEYERLSKTYHATILFGLETDTYDILGLITKEKKDAPISHKHLESILKNLCGKHMQQYPAYSSALANGKPLFYWARKGKLNEIHIPKKRIEIYTISLTALSLSSKKDIASNIFKRLSSVKGNFRQNEIIDRWKTHFQKNDFESYYTAEISVSCSSGTYIRSLVHSIGEKLDIPATVFSLTRTSVGNYSLKNALSVLSEA